MTPTSVTACVALLLSVPLQRPFQPGLSPAPVVAHRVSVLREWVAAVERHKPGETDAAALVPSVWTAIDLQAAWVDVNAFIALLKDPKMNTFRIRPSDQSTEFSVFTTKEDLAAMRALAIDVKWRMTQDVFFKRAAILHTDVVLAVLRDELLTAVGSSVLAPQRFVVRTEDGKQLGIHGGLVHWEFARLLLDAVREPSRDPTVRSWYQATLAYKLAREELDTVHFERALALFPDDAVIRFQLGCLHEAFADPRVQTVIPTVVLPSMTQLDVQSEADELQDAERFFRRALEIDPAHAEARVRHGRVLGRLGRHKEAAAQLRLALGSTRAPLLIYYAQLFLGAEEEALGRFDEARAAYDEALHRYPRAQAPRMARSQLAHRRGDRVSARDALGDVLQPSDTKSEHDDPWWHYLMAPGRHADDLVAAVYRAVAADADRR